MKGHVLQVSVGFKDKRNTVFNKTCQNCPNGRRRGGDLADYGCDRCGVTTHKTNVSGLVCSFSRNANAVQSGMSYLVANVRVRI